MNEKERLEKVLRHEVTDRPPCICPGGMMNMITTDLMDRSGITWPEAHLNAEMMADLAQANYENGCFENVGVPFCMTIEAEAMGAQVTMGDRVHEPHVTEYALHSVSEWEKLRTLDINSGRTKVVLDAIRILKSRNLNVPIIGNITGPVSTASSVMEPVVFYKELRKKKEDAHKYMELVSDEIIRFARAQIDAGADIIAISDPSGTGEILGPKLFEEYAVYYINRIIDHLQNEKMGVIVHICGQMRNVYAQAEMIHSDVLSFDSCVAMSDAKKHLRKHVLMGNVSTWTLEFGKPEKVEQLAAKCWKDGSGIISPACGLGTKSPLANIQAIKTGIQKAALNSRTAEKRESLLEQLLAEGRFVDNPCNGKGVCGKCKVKILSGDAGKVTETEKRFLSAEELEQGIRLACMVFPEEKLEVETLQEDRKAEVLSEGYVPEFEKDTDIEKHVVNLRKPSLKNQTSLEDQLLEQLEEVEVPVTVLQKLELREGIYTAVIWKDKISAGQERIERRTLLDLEEGDQSGNLYGVAIDIGTTTVVASLIDMMTGKELVNASRVNAQKTFGLDVLTRISYELEHPEDGRRNLQKAIVDSINEMIEEVCGNVVTAEKTGIRKEDIFEITVAANCTMMHMLLGISARSIGKAPYAPVFVKAKNLPASEIGIQAGKGARLYCLPAVSAYIGADIVAGAYVCELQKASGNVLFIDIGTNGEIVFSDHGKLLSCSCAAGPALEGMNISSGMRAAAGAVEDVKITEHGVKLQIIGEEKPAGICGSGILAVVKELRRTGVIRKDGAFIKMKDIAEGDYRYSLLEADGRKRKFKMTDELKVTQGDIRQVQLAKGAILSGFYALLKKAGKTMKELDQVMIAGQFGAHLPVESLIGTGILPKEVKDKIVYVGNSSKTGAHLALMSGRAREEMEELAHHMDYLELGATEGYERLFADCLMFPEE